MKRFIHKMRQASRNEKGAVTPILMMMSGILFVSGMAFLGVGMTQTSMIGSTSSEIQARYNAEQGARVAMWRMGRTDISDWPSWATFSDTMYAADYDDINTTITGIGHYQGVTDSVKVHVQVDTLYTAMYLANVILYKKHLHLDSTVVINVPFEENGPEQLKGWGANRVARKPKYKHAIFGKGKFFKKSNKHGKSKKKDFVHVYNGNQTFEGVMEDGIHIVKGNAHLHDGTVLNGTIAATGHVSFSGHVEINAKLFPFPSDYKFKSKKKSKKWNKSTKAYDGAAQPDSAYLPAVIALRGSDIDQEDTDDSEDMLIDTNDPGAPTTDIVINGMMYSTRRIHLENLTLNGSIVGKSVIIEGNSTITFDPTYIAPTPPYIEIITGYAVGPVTWND